MPIYEYQCEECGRTTEALQRIDEAPLSECPHCGGPLRKLISAPAFQFKGSGWYVTDYAKKGGGGGKGAGSESAGGGEGGGSKAESGSESSAKGSGGGGESAGRSSAKPSGGGTGDAS